jgi:hypothetical protein
MDAKAPVELAAMLAFASDRTLHPHPTFRFNRIELQT